MSLIFSRNSTKEEQIQQVELMVATMGERPFCQMAAEHLVSLARPEKAMPESLVRFAPMVRDGIVFFLSQISYPRLRRAVLSQAKLKDDCEIGERLLDLALHFPTLHKLGQIIARNPGLDPGLKGWLIRLEKGHYRTDTAELVQVLTDWLSGVEPGFKIILEPHILAEASVAAVLRFTFQRKNRTKRSTGVFKVLKPRIEEHLQQELFLIEKVAIFLENHRQIYGLQDMMVVDLFNEIRDDLIREIDLAAEQKNLVEARKIYSTTQDVHIPELFSFCTPAITSMEFLDGIKVTDVETTAIERHNLARLVFEAIICMPLFSLKKAALFHGDPHAGNILILPGKTASKPHVALIDWTLAAHLKRAQRGYMVEMMVGIITEDVQRICETINLLLPQSPSPAKMMQIKGCVTAHIVSQDHPDDPLKNVFQLMAQLTMEGFVFPAEMILFRKTFFTLEGVLADISPGFSMAEALQNYLGQLLLAEVPLRVTAAFLPAPDDNSHYKTLLSNQDLGKLSFSQSLSALHKGMTMTNLIFESQIKMMSGYYSYLSFLISR